MHSLAVNVREGLPLAWDLSLENSADSYLCFYWLYFTQCLTSFSSINHLLCRVFHSISSNIDEVTLINSPINTFIFGDFNVHHKDWLTYSRGADGPGELL